MHGVIDDCTLVWGQGLIDWLPVKNVRTLVPQIRTVEGACSHPSLEVHPKHSEIVVTISLKCLRAKAPWNEYALHNDAYAVWLPDNHEVMRQWYGT